MSKTDPRIVKLLDDMRISAERIISTAETQTGESFPDSERSWASQDIIARRLSIIGKPRHPWPENSRISVKNIRKYRSA